MTGTTLVPSDDRRAVQLDVGIEAACFVAGVFVSQALFYGTLARAGGVALSVIGVVVGLWLMVRVRRAWPLITTPAGGVAATGRPSWVWADDHQALRLLERHKDSAWGTLLTCPVLVVSAAFTAWTFPGGQPWWALVALPFVAVLALRIRRRNLGGRIRQLRAAMYPPATGPWAV